MKLSLILIVGLCLSCKPYSITNESHKLTSEGDYLKVSYGGEEDSVVFKMFQALELTLKKNNEIEFSGEIEIPGLDSAIFSYVIDTYKKSDDGSFDNLDSDQSLNTEDVFIWKGSKCDATFGKAENLKGELEVKASTVIH